MSPADGAGSQPARSLMDRTTFWFALVAAVSALALWWRDGTGELVAALGGAVLLLMQIAPVMIAAMLVGGYIQAMLPHDRVARWIGPQSGARGFVIAYLAGALTPAGPFAVFPILLALREAGGGFATCVVYITAWATVGVQRVMIWELPFLGPDFVLLRVLASLPLPVLAGLMAAAVAKRVAP